jgi:cytochrome P450
MREEISVGVNATVGKCKDWTPVQLQMNMAIIVSMLTSRVFVGLPLTRDKNWLRIIMEHVGNVMHFADRLRKYPDFLRPLVVRLLPEYTVVQNTKAAISSALEQRLLQNSAAYKACSTDNLRLSTWLMEKYKQERKRARDIQLIIRDHLTLFMAATGFPTLAVCHILIDLAAYPEYLPQLREEIENELEASAEGVLDGKVLPKLRLLDSFCKESSRMNPPGVGK